MKNFIGREKELEEIRDLLEIDSANLVVIRGRRRIGKSRLIREFGSSLPSLFFSGVPPTKKTTANSERAEFARQMEYLLKIKNPNSSDWSLLFRELAAHTREGRVVIVLDEISWLGSKDSDFLGKLKNAWDLEFSHNPQLILFLCGSVSSWIERNILSSTGFVGRISLNMKIKELPLEDACQFWKSQKNRIDPYEIFKTLSITGGIPRYLEEIAPHRSAEENINRICFKESGILFDEFERIFNDLFSTRAPIYTKILLNMCDKSIFLKDIYKVIGVEPSGSYAEYMDDLDQAGFIARDYTWDIKTGKDSNLSRFRISDNYVRFYLKSILPNKAKILAGNYDTNSLFHRENWKTTLGLQFENLVLNNIQSLYKQLKLSPGDVMRSGPYFQRASSKKKGCQIDLLIQTYHRILYLVEIKFSQDKISNSVKKEIQQKIDHLALPRGFSVKPVLVHVNGVAENFHLDRFFSHVIDFSSLLK